MKDYLVRFWQKTTLAIFVGRFLFVGLAFLAAMLVGYDLTVRLVILIVLIGIANRIGDGVTSILEFRASYQAAMKKGLADITGEETHG